MGGREARLGSWGPGRGPSWGEYRSGGTGGSHPGIKVPDLPPGVRPISHSHGGLREPGGGAPPGGSTDQVVPGVATLEWIFLRTCLQWARALLWGQVQLMGALPCHGLQLLPVQLTHMGEKIHNDSQVPCPRTHCNADQG